MSEESERKIYSEREKLLLITLVEQNALVIENKKTEGINLQKKQETWEKICRIYNSNDVTKRNIKQLKKLWDNFKQKTRKADSDRRNYMLKTGGGCPLVEPDDPLKERIRSIVPTIDLEVINEYDSIAVFSEEKKEKVNDTSLATPGTSKEISSTLQDHMYDNIRNEVEVIDTDSNKEYEMTQDSESLTQEKENNNISTPVGKRKRGKQVSKCSSVIINEEAGLRKKKLVLAIQQQEEFHNARMEAIAQEKKYWQVKTELAQKHSTN